MHTTLIIKDLSVELDATALRSVRGGEGNQANGTSQANAQQMAAMANVGNASMFLGPTTIQSDNTFTQSASNYNFAENFKGLSIDLAPTTLVRGL